MDFTVSASASMSSAGDNSHDAPSYVNDSSDSIDGGEKRINAQAKEKAKKKKKKIKPRLKPISSPDEIDKFSPGDEMFGNFLPKSANESTNAPSNEPSDVGNRKGKKLRPKLQPVLSKNDSENISPGGDGLGFGDIVTNNSGTHVVDESSSAALTTPSNSKVEGKGKLHISTTKIKPRTSPYPPAHTPDDDDYDAFGFDLIKTGQKDSIEGGTLTPPAPGAITPNQTSPVALRRALSSDSYISDDSSSSDESLLHPHHQIKRDLMKDDELKNMYAKGAPYSPQRVDRQSSIPSHITNQSRISSVSFSTSVLGTDTTIDSHGQSNVHMMCSYQGDTVGSNDASFSSSDSSDGESSYFSAHRATPQSHQLQSPQVSKPHSYPNYTNPQGVAYTTPPPQQLNPSLKMRSKSLSLPPDGTSNVSRDDVIELKLSLSEEESASNNNGGSLRASPLRQTGTPYSQGSISSVDDQGIANELSAYSLSTKLRRGSVESDSPSGRLAPLDGHHANSVIQPSPANTFDTQTPVRSFYASPESALLAATTPSTAKPQPHHDSSFLTNLRDGWMGGSVASVSEGSFISSPRGAFGEPGAEPDEAGYEVSPHDQSAKSSGTQTPQISLAYSDEEDNERRLIRRGSKTSIFAAVDEEEEATATKHLPKIKVYSTRWIMLFYIFLLNLMGDLTCFSIAPISIIVTKELDVDPEYAVVLFLAATCIGTFIEPALLGWLGLRRTVLFGSLLLMSGSIVKSGSASFLKHFDEEVIVYVGFVLAGLSQPLYQCTSCMVVNGWFPEWERSFASGMVSSSKKIGIACAFLVCHLFVNTSKQVLSYFHALSVITIVLFVGVSMQFEDAPPTSPSESVGRVIRGTVERPLTREAYHGAPRSARSGKMQSQSPKVRRGARSKYRSNGSIKTPLLPSFASFGSDVIAPAPSAAYDGPTELVMEQISNMAEYEALVQAPSPMMPGPVGGGDSTPVTIQTYGSTDASLAGQQFANAPPSERSEDPTSSPFQNLKGEFTPRPGTPLFPGLISERIRAREYLPPTEDDGVEPIVVQTPRLLDLDIRSDQIWRSLQACYSRKGFSHCILAFATAGAVTNTISIFMAYLVTLNGDGEDYVGIVGAAFQLAMMISSITCRRWDDQSSRYYIIIIALLALGALLLALCDAYLDESEGLWSLFLVVAVFVGGPLQYFSTELGVAIASPLSKSTVVTIQQLFSNLLTAMCIPAFKMLKDYSFSMPDFTFSFYLLVLIHVISTIYFTSFDAKCLQNDDEGSKKFSRSQTPPGHEVGNISYPKPKPPLGRDPSWGKKYPFLIPSGTM